jgi:hypothetical protein
VIRMAYRPNQQDNLLVHERVGWCCPTSSTSVVYQRWESWSFEWWRGAARVYAKVGEA